MSDAKDKAFDPYHRWLGIPRAQRPPTHYQILGLEAGESDIDVIEEAVVRQSTYLRSYQNGPHGEICARLLCEVALAGQVLTNPAKKRDYDEHLKRKASLAAPAAPESSVSVQPSRRFLPPAALPETLDDLDAAPLSEAGQPKRDRARNIRKPARLPVVLLAAIGGAALVLLAAVVGVILILNRPPAPKVELVAEKKPVVPPPVMPMVKPLVPPKPDPKPDSGPANPPPKVAVRPAHDHFGYWQAPTADGMVKQIALWNWNGAWFLFVCEMKDGKAVANFRGEKITVADGILAADLAPDRIADRPEPRPEPRLDRRPVHLRLTDGKVVELDAAGKTLRAYERLPISPKLQALFGDWSCRLDDGRRFGIRFRFSIMAGMLEASLGVNEFDQRIRSSDWLEGVRLHEDGFRGEWPRPLPGIRSGSKILVLPDADRVRMEIYSGEKLVLSRPLARSDRPIPHPQSPESIEGPPEPPVEKQKLPPLFTGGFAANTYYGDWRGPGLQGGLTKHVTISLLDNDWHVSAVYERDGKLVGSARGNKFTFDQDVIGCTLTAEQKPVPGIPDREQARFRLRDDKVVEIDAAGQPLIEYERFPIPEKWPSRYATWTGKLDDGRSFEFMLGQSIFGKRNYLHAKLASAEPEMPMPPSSWCLHPRLSGDNVRIDWRGRIAGVRSFSKILVAPDGDRLRMEIYDGEKLVESISMKKRP